MRVIAKYYQIDSLEHYHVIKPKTFKQDQEDEDGRGDEDDEDYENDEDRPGYESDAEVQEFPEEEGPDKEKAKSVLTKERMNN